MNSEAAGKRQRRPRLSGVTRASRKLCVFKEMKYTHVCVDEKKKKKTRNHPGGFQKNQIDITGEKYNYWPDKQKNLPTSRGGCVAAVEYHECECVDRDRRGNDKPHVTKCGCKSRRQGYGAYLKFFLLLCTLSFLLLLLFCSKKCYKYTPPHTHTYPQSRSSVSWPCRGQWPIKWQSPVHGGT